MASTGSVDGWPLGPTELGEAGLRVLLRMPTQVSSSYTELKSSCARHDVRIRISSICIILYNGLHVIPSLHIVSVSSPVLNSQWCQHKCSASAAHRAPR